MRLSLKLPGSPMSHILKGLLFAVPASESGSNNNFYYSFDAGGLHFVMLGAHVDYNHTGKFMEYFHFLYFYFSKTHVCFVLVSSVSFL